MHNNVFMQLLKIGLQTISVLKTLFLCRLNNYCNFLIRRIQLPSATESNPILLTG